MKKKKKRNDTRVRWSKAVYLWTLQGHIKGVHIRESYILWRLELGYEIDIFAWKELYVKRHVQMRVYKKFINVFLSKNLVISRFPDER